MTLHYKWLETRVGPQRAFPGGPDQRTGERERCACPTTLNRTARHRTVDGHTYAVPRPLPALPCPALLLRQAGRQAGAAPSGPAFLRCAAPLSCSLFLIDLPLALDTRRPYHSSIPSEAKYTRNALTATNDLSRHAVKRGSHTHSHSYNH